MKAHEADEGAPQTLEGLKRRAQKYRKKQGMKHCLALDRVAMEMGFNNYAHARKELGDDGRPV